MGALPDVDVLKFISFIRPFFRGNNKQKYVRNTDYLKYNFSFYYSVAFDSSPSSSVPYTVFHPSTTTTTTKCTCKYLCIRVHKSSVYLICIFESLPYAWAKKERKGSKKMKLFVSVKTRNKLKFKEECHRGTVERENLHKHQNSCSSKTVFSLSVF